MVKHYDMFYSIILVYGVLLSDALQGSFEHAGLADLCIVFGSSLTVTPAADVPQVPTLHNNYVIINDVIII